LILPFDFGGIAWGRRRVRGFRGDASFAYLMTAVESEAVIPSALVFQPAGFLLAVPVPSVDSVVGGSSAIQEVVLQERRMVRVL
jgi:hypothetical protein